MSVAAPLVQREGDRPRLEGMVRSSSIRAGLAQRARIVLLAAEGLPNAEIARRTGTSRPTVVDWRARYEAGGITALHDQPRSGRPPPESMRSTSWWPPWPTMAGHRPILGWFKLVGPAVGCRVGDLVRFGGADLAQVGVAAVAGCRRSSSPPTPNLTRRSATLSGCISSHRRLWVPGTVSRASEQRLRRQPGLAVQLAGPPA